jgi:lipopolysaccharide/colanic/teichoic acid biosynthesis glycosyltransferase
VSTWLRLRIQLDRVVALVLLVILAPVIGALSVAVWRSDRGPALITVPRVGRDGRTFRMWKLRSMRADTADGRATGVALTTGVDDRITPIGRRLRAWYLDELPQLWNVVRGEMCLLGARPEAPEFVDLHDPRWRHILQVPPGLAGPTQLIVNDWERQHISNAPDGSDYVPIVLPVKLAIDEWYVRRASVHLDAQVAMALVRRLLPFPPSRHLADRVCHEVPASRAVRAGTSPVPSETSPVRSEKSAVPVP